MFTFFFICNLYMKTSNYKPILILVLLVIVVVLMCLNFFIGRQRKQIENFQSETTSAIDSSSPDLFKNTYEIADYSQSPQKLLNMFSSLEEAEKRCDMLESQQFQREQRDEMRENDRTYKQLQEQDKKIHELKEIVKYLTIEKKRRDKIDKSCKSTKQRKLNEQYNIVKQLNDTGMLKDNSVDLDLNITDSQKLKSFIRGLDSQRKTANQQAEDTDTQNYVKCKDKGDGYVDIDGIGLEKCNRCDAGSLAAQENYIHKDFN